MMKEQYFTLENLSQKTTELLDFVSVYRCRHAGQEFDPGQAALLVLDMQEYFLDPVSHAFVPSAPAIVGGIRSLVDAFSSAGRPVVFTRHLNTQKDAGMMATWWKDLVTLQDARSQIINTLPLSKGISIKKTQYDAFLGGGLGDLLKGAQVLQVVVTGVMTHLCCEMTARSAFVHGYQVFFPVDGTATYNEAHHRASLLNLSHGFAVMTTVPDLLKQITSHSQ